MLVEGPEPVRVASLFRHMPGVSWVAVGLAAESFNELKAGSADLARRYLRRGYRFSVLAEASGNVASGDVAGTVVSAALEAVRGTRTDEAKPRVRFRAAFDGARGAVGVELSDGPGGVPTGAEGVTCLVSGGKHSSVLCWMALLAGFRVRMVHAKVDERSLVAVADLYEEVSHRVDPIGLSLEVLQGGDPASSLLGAVQKVKGSAFGGFHSACSRVPAAMKGKVGAPIYLLPEESFELEFRELRLKRYEEKLDWGMTGPRAARRLAFGGVRADISQVLDGLR